MKDATTKEIVDSFFAVLSCQPVTKRRSITYDQGRERHGHKVLTERNGVQGYFAAPHSPWQGGSNENINGLLRQYLPLGSDLPIAFQVNTPPRKRPRYKSPLVVYTEHMRLLQHQSGTVH